MKNSQNYAITLKDIGVEKKIIKDFLGSAIKIKELTNKNISNIFINPTIRKQNKIQLLKQICSLIKADKYFTEVLLMLIRNNDGHIFNEFIGQFIIYANKHLEKTHIVFISNNIISNACKLTIQSTLEKKLNKQIYLEYKTDQSIIGGFIIDIDSNILDLSYRKKINQMQNILKEELSKIDFLSNFYH